MAVARLRKAIEQGKRFGVLGTGVFETAFDFRVDVRIGAGAFVCGEETALMASIKCSAQFAMATATVTRWRYQDQGCVHCPTAHQASTSKHSPMFRGDRRANFVSTGSLASAPIEKSKGTKVFSLTGKVRNTGLIEVPMGTTLRHIVEVMGGGVPDGGRVKAVQTGGPSGGCIPAAVPRHAGGLRVADATRPRSWARAA